MSTPDTSTLAGKIAVMQAVLDGKPIECRKMSWRTDDWMEATTPTWDWGEYEYRIKPEPEVTWEPTGAPPKWMRCEEDGHFHFWAGGPRTGAWYSLHIEQRAPSGETRWVPVEVEE